MFDKKDDKVRHYQCNACEQARPCKFSMRTFPLDLDFCPLDGEQDSSWVEVEK